MKLGHIRAAGPHPNAIPLAQFLGASAMAATLPESVELPARIDNQQSEDCTGSYSISVETWCAARNIPCKIVSRRGGYTLGRQIMAADPSAMLVDAGADPNAVIEGMRSFGVISEDSCPGDGPDVINQRLTFGQLEVVWKVSAVANITSSGTARCSDIRVALANNFPVPFGMNLRQSYDQIGSDGLYAPAGNYVGGHAQRIIGYTPTLFIVAGSYGLGFAKNGFVLLTDEQIASDDCFDFAAIDVAPGVTQ